MSVDNLRIIILKVIDLLSDKDRKNLHFVLNNHVPRPIRDDTSRAGTLVLMECLFDQNKLNGQDFTILINALEEIHCVDAAKLLRSYRKQIQANQETDRKQMLKSTAIVETIRQALQDDDEESDKFNTQTNVLINHLNNCGNNNTTINRDNTITNAVVHVQNMQDTVLSLTKSKQSPNLGKTIFKCNFLLLLLLTVLLGAVISAWIYQNHRFNIIIREKDRIIEKFSEQIESDTIYQFLDTDLRTIHWAGYSWYVKDTMNDTIGVNNWSSSNVWVDSDDKLHLKIRYSNRTKKWTCSEIHSKRKFSFGTFQWFVEGPIDKFDPNVVFSLFTFEDINGIHRINIDMTKWGKHESDAHNLFSSVFPSSLETLKPVISSTRMILQGTYTTHQFTWTPYNVSFQSQHGFMYSSDKYMFHTYTTPQSFTSMTPHADASVYMNLRTFQGKPTIDKADVEIIIHAFKYVEI